MEKIANINILPKWIGEAKSKMYIRHITQKKMAKDLDYTEPYLSAIFQGKVHSATAQKRIEEYLKEAQA
jgi:predicted transcriptional regulator